jgi:cell division protein FtsB
MKKTFIYILTGFFIIFMIIGGSMLLNSWTELRGMRQKIAGLEETMNRKNSELLELKQEVYDLKHNPEAIETIAREKFRLVEKGEFVYTLEEKKNKQIRNKKKERKK